MSMTDPLSDMLTRIRNGQQARLLNVSAPYSKLKENVLNVLQREGFIEGFSKSKDASEHPALDIVLKYNEGVPAIKELKKVSKPGRRNYSRIRELKKVYNGLGVAIVSTSKGVMSDFEARQHNVGGEVLCLVF